MDEPTRQMSAAGRELPARWLAIICVIWAGQAVSMITSYAAGFAAVWYVTETTSSALMLSLASICAYLPTGLVSPFGGVVADRCNRKLIMIVADLSVGVVSLVLGVLIVLGQASVGLILVMAVVRSVGQAFHGPAMMASMPHLVPERHLLRINTLDQLLMSIAAIASSAFGILLYTTIGFHSVMFLDFFGAVAAVAGLALAQIPRTHDASMDSQHVFANLADGWRALAAHRGLVWLIGGITCGMMLFGPMGALYPLMTLEHFGGDGFMASIAEAAWGAGMLLGSLILMLRNGTTMRLARLIAISCVIVGATTAACGLLPPTGFVAFVALCAVMAVAAAWFNGPMVTLVQRSVPEEKMGRALGFTTALFGIASPVGIALGGPLAEQIGVAQFFVVDGACGVALGVALLLSRSIRALDTRDARRAASDAGIDVGV